MHRLALIFLIFQALPYFANAQNVKIKRIQLANNKVIVTYDLDDSNVNNEYQLNLYTSKDNFTVPMTKVKGDIGNEIKPGNDRKVEWNVREEFGDFDGDIALEIRGRVFVMFAKLVNFDTKKNYKRGKTYPINWKPGNTNPVHIELFKGSERLVGELNHPNNGTYLLTMPPHAKRGDDYRIRLTDSKRPGEFIYSDFFNLKPRVPFIAKAIAGAVVLGGIGFVAKPGSGGTGSTVDETQPNPPALPTN